jgi:hypothetical protein
MMLMQIFSAISHGRLSVQDPVGSMQALVFATIFPGQAIHVLDQYRENVRGHGLEIHKNTIEEILQYFAVIKKIPQLF